MESSLEDDEEFLQKYLVDGENNDNEDNMTEFSRGNSKISSNHIGKQLSQETLSGKKIKKKLSKSSSRSGTSNFD